MFVDYYAILGIGIHASTDEIKTAFKREALKWHPDKNPGKDTTVRMQQINEAYLMLKDNEARAAYNAEYTRYHEQKARAEQQRQQHRAQQQQQRQEQRSETQEQQGNYEDSSYVVNDELLRKWMANARRQSVDLAKQTLEDLIGMSKASGSAMGDAALKGVFRLIGFSVLMLILVKACSK